MGMLPNYKEIIELIKKGSTLEAQEKIIELREIALNLQDENFDLKQKINELEKSLEIKDRLEWDGVIYWLKNESAEQRDGPYCQRCYDVEKKLVRLQQAQLERTKYWVCLECEKNYFPKSIQYE